ncbi:MAG: NrfD/PsrC family molybdoenzyme membrane anchor subunit [Desulforegulaceae bacterium]|nr:NrfD/PsrC family molybdoenzyme membrane anchor subunit [Desulforegulaceae bacterium]
MLEKALSGSKKYGIWIGFLLLLIGGAFIAYLQQLNIGLGVTGLSRDVSWGFYIAQFTFLVGVAAGGVMVVLPFYIHNYKDFGRITVLGEFLAIGTIVMCLLFIIVDLGYPSRLFNVIIHYSPRSMLFWDMVVLNGYLLINIVVGWNVLQAERNGVSYKKWVKFLAYVSIPMAVGIHTVTAYLYCGLPGRGYWLTAILAPRFLASAFAAGPALLIILALIVQKTTKFDPGDKAIDTLSKIVCYALIANVFFFLCEVFVTFYSQNPHHMETFQFFFQGIDGKNAIVPWMWASMFLMGFGILFLVIPRLRTNRFLLPITCSMVFIGAWIDKGMGLITGGFNPTPLNHITEYSPTGLEIMISIGIYAIGLLIITVLFKIATAVKEEVGA